VAVLVAGFVSLSLVVVARGNDGVDTPKDMGEGAIYLDKQE
jgi:hypothetical protein